MGVLKVRNIYGFTTEQIKGVALRYKLDDNSPVCLGILTHADEDYLYADCGGNEELLIEFRNDVSVELGSD